MPERIEPGIVIALDGPDGVGKTEQVRLLGEYFTGLGRHTHTTRHSGGTPIGEELRKVSLSHNPRPPETDLYITLAMGMALSEDNARRKAAGEIVIIDRSPLSAIAYQAYGDEMEDKQIVFDTCEKLIEAEQIGLLIFLTAAMDILMSRRNGRGATDYFELKGLDYHKRVDEGYKDGLEFLRHRQGAGLKVITVDATPDIQTVHQTIVENIDNLEI